MYAAEYSLGVDRELTGLCKQALLLLRKQLKDYINQAHDKETGKRVEPVIVNAAHELFACVLQDCRMAEEEREEDCVPLEVLAATATTVDGPPEADANRPLISEGEPVQLAIAAPVKTVQKTNKKTSPVKAKSAAADIEIEGNDDHLADVSVAAGSRKRRRRSSPAVQVWVDEGRSSASPASDDSGMYVPSGQAAAGCVQCPYCGKYMLKQKYLDTHIESFHSENPTRLKCSKCDYVATQTASLNRHYNSRHAKDPKVFRCHECGYEAKRSDHIRAHAKRVHAIFM